MVSLAFSGLSCCAMWISIDSPTMGWLLGVQDNLTVAGRLSLVQTTHKGQRELLLLKAMQKQCKHCFHTDINSQLRMQI